MHEPERKRRRGSRDPSASTRPLGPTADVANTVGNQALQRLLQHGARIDSPTSANEREAEQAATKPTMPATAASSIAPNPSPLASEVRAGFGPGQPLDSDLRTQLGPVVGANLDAVRVHTDAPAAQAARALDANAWTLGNDVFLGPTAASMRSPQGRALMAHELTHVVQQSDGAKPRIARQPLTPGATADPQAALRARLQQVRARLAVLRPQQTQSQDAFAASVVAARERESLAREGPKLKAQARSAGAAKELWGDTFAIDRIKSAAQIAQSGKDVNLTARLQLSYLALDDKKGRAQSEIDIPRIAKAIMDSWQVTIPDGEYAGLTLRLTPQITFLPPGTKRSDAAFLIRVRGADKDPSSGDSVSGTISLAPVHLQGSRVIVVAHELAHLFGFVDSYFSMTRKPKKGPVVEEWHVARGDPANRPDLMGVIDPALLKKFLDKGGITKEEFSRQSSTTPHIWAEDAAIVLRTFGIAPPPKPRPTIESEDFDPEVELAEIARPLEKQLSDIREKRSRIDDSMAWLDRAEEVMRLEKEERDLSAQLSATPP